eukprot:gene8056-10075_t
MLSLRGRVFAVFLCTLIALNIYVYLEHRSARVNYEREKQIYQNTLNLATDCEQQLSILQRDENNIRKKRKEIVVEDNGLLLSEQSTARDCFEKIQHVKEKELYEVLFKSARLRSRTNRDLNLYTTLLSIEAIAKLSETTPGAVMQEDPSDDALRNTLIASLVAQSTCSVEELQSTRTDIVTEITLGITGWSDLADLSSQADQLSPSQS